MSGLSGMSDRVVETLARLHRYAESQPQKEQTPPPITIALSREAGSRGAEIARAAGAQLGWPVYDNELLARIAEEKGLHTRLLERLDERYVGWLEEVINSFASHESSREGAYLRHLLELFASLSRAGHSIIVGRGAPHVLPPETTLRVRIVAPLEARIAQIEQSKKLSRTAAQRWVAQTDDDRARFVKHYFHKDVDAPLGYDLMLNSGRFSTQECAEMIVQAARIMEMHPREAPSALTRA